MLFVFIINTVVVAIAVLIHYEFLQQSSKISPKLPLRPRMRIIFGVTAALMAHVLEIWMFAIVYYLMHHNGKWGTLQGNFTGSLLDCAYFSFTTFSTLGFGDIEPIGNIRYLTGIESLTGLVLITWTASFLFNEMQKNWR